MKYRKGSAGASEAKEMKVVMAFIGVVTILFLLCLFVFDTDLKYNVLASPFWMNAVGFCLVLGSGYPIFRAFKAMEEGVKSYIIAWAVMLALGVFVSCGFFGYTY